MTTTNDPSRSIEYRGLDSLVPDPRNPKSHSLETIDASIGRFGVVDPIVLDGRTGFIISGHGRAKTLQSMHARGEGAPEGINVTTKDEWEVPVSVGWSSRTDTEAAAALIALNRTTELGGWVDDELLSLLSGLDEIDDGLEGVGFTTEDLAALQDKLVMPDFQPDEDYDNSVRLDRQSITDCPNCGHTFSPATRSVTLGDSDSTDTDEVDSPDEDE